jgi:hypothetical protein
MSPNVRTFQDLSNFVGGRWIPSSAAEFVDVTQPRAGVVIAKNTAFDRHRSRLPPSPPHESVS